MNKKGHLLLAERIQYEKQFTQYLLSDNDQPALNMETVTSTDDLKDQLCRLHEKYEQEQTDFETDERYICQAVSYVIHYFTDLCAEINAFLMLQCLK